jgi:hypothetical protein
MALNFRNAVTAGAVLLGVAVASAANSAAEPQIGNGNTDQTGGGTSRNNGNNSTTRIAIDGHVLLITGSGAAQRVFVDNVEMFGQDATEAVKAGRSGQPWWQ